MTETRLHLALESDICMPYVYDQCRFRSPRVTYTWQHIRLPHWGSDKWPPFCRRHFQCISMNERYYILIEFLQKFVSRGPVVYKPALAKTMAWCQTGGKPLFNLMMTLFSDGLDELTLMRLRADATLDLCALDTWQLPANGLPFIAQLDRPRGVTVNLFDTDDSRDHRTIGYCAWRNKSSFIILDFEFWKSEIGYLSQWM